MRTFNRYFIHFMGIGIIFFLAALLLIILDGGELLVPIFLIALTFVDICFVVLMTLVFSSMAEPRKVRLIADDDTIKALEHLAQKKWGRKQTIQEENITRFTFGNKYKDWLATPIELVKNKNAYILYLPSSYVEDVKSVCDNNVDY